MHVTEVSKAPLLTKVIFHVQGGIECWDQVWAKVASSINIEPQMAPYSRVVYRELDRGMGQ